MIGKITSLKEVKVKSEGVKKNGTPWVLWGTKVGINNTELSVSGFDKSEVEKMIAGLAVGDTVEYETKREGKYTNIKTIAKTDKEFVPAAEVKVEGVDFDKILKELGDTTTDVLDMLTENTKPDMLQAKLQVFFELLKEKGAYERTELTQKYKQANMKSYRGD